MVLESLALPDDALAPDFGNDDKSHELVPGVAWKRLAIVNCVFLGEPGGPWILVDAGVPGFAGSIVHAADERFGIGRSPEFILLTHGHFDHVGSLESILKTWDVPVYAHPLERPFLDGTSAYPPPDTTTGGGVMPHLAPLFPRDAIDVESRLRDLPSDGTVPGFPEWRWIHTPGHTPGHVSLFREADRTLVAGDAIITTRQESAYAILMQKPEMYGPPSYFTPDWPSALRSVQVLADLRPAAAITGHGRAVVGPLFTEALTALGERAARTSGTP